MKRTITITLMLCLLFTFSMTGCGGKETTEGSTVAENSAASAGETKGETVKSDKRTDLVIGKASEAYIITPFTDTLLPNKNDMFILCSMYDTLLYLDSTTGEVLPNVATKWEVSDDGLTYTFTLRDDVTFWDGTHLTAEDVAFGIEQAAASSMGPVYYINYKSAEAVDETTLVVTLSAPNASFLNTFAGLGCYLFSKTRFEEEGGWDGFTKNPLGSGPYQYVSAEVGSSLTLKAYDGYWGTKPSVDTITIKYISDLNSQIIALESGEVDILYDAPISTLKLVEGKKGINWSYTESYVIGTLHINTCTEGGPLLDDNLRKAIISAIDYEAINTSVFDGLSSRPEAASPMTYTGMPDSGDFTPQIGYNIEEAKKYLAASNYNGAEIRLRCVSGTKEETASKIIQGCLQEIGINCQIYASDTATVMSALRSTGDYELILYSGMGPLYDAIAYHQTLTQGPASLADFYPEALELATDGISCTNPEERKEIYAKLLTLLHENAYNSTVFVDCTTLAWRDGVTGCENCLPGVNYRMNSFGWAD